MQTNKNRPIAHAVLSHEQNTELFQHLETAKCRIREIKADPETHADELRHWEKKAEKVTAQLIEANFGLVRSISGQYARKSGKYNELSECLFYDGCYGLSKAIDKFDYRRDCSLSTYAFPWIKQAISRSPALQTSLQAPEGRRAEIRKVKELMARLAMEYDRKPTAEDIAKEMGISVKKAYDLYAAATLTLVHMDAPILDADGMTHGASIQDKSAHDPSEAADHASKLELVGEAAQTLVGLEREIFVMHLYDHLSLNEIGKSFGRSGERIRQIYNTALKKVRAYVEVKDRKQPVQVLKAVVVKNGPSQTAQAALEPTSSPVAKPKVYRLKMRAVEKNPNHHITNNNGTWYCKFTLELADGGKNEVRNSLYTDNVEDARKRRDKLILLYRGLSESFAA